MANRYFMKNCLLGLGVASWDGFNLGYTKNQAKFDFSYDIEQFKTDAPLVLTGQTTKELMCSFTVGLAELSPQNVGIMLGGLNVQVTGGLVTIGPSDNQTRTFNGNFYGTSGYQFLSLDGINSVGLVLKSADGQTTYLNGVDYFLLGASDVVLRLPGGAIPVDGQVQVTYQYTKAMGEQVNLGAVFNMNIGRFDFVHKRQNFHKLPVSLRMHKAQANGAISFNFQESTHMVNDLVVNGIYSDEHPLNPMGYIHWQQQAA